MELGIADCGCISHNECGICFEVICNGKLDKTICDKCWINNKETNDSGKLIHPIKRNIITMCNCGKPFNPECSRLGLFPNAYTIDPSK